jgi:hypothetical protein
MSVTRLIKHLKLTIFYIMNKIPHKSNITINGLSFKGLTFIRINIAI